ncbi:MAG: methyltransferase domain-containing protein [Acidobacteriota bacterium]
MTADPLHSAAPRPSLRARSLQVTLTIAPVAMALVLIALGPTAGTARAQDEHAGHDKHSEHGQHAEHGQHTDGLRHDFSDVARWSARFDDPSRDDWQKPDEVAKMLGAVPGAIVADLGAGTGYFLGPLSRAVGAGGRVLALEPEETLVEHMRERAAQAGWAQVEVRQIGYDDPGLEPESVDGILIVNTWHHLGDRPRYAAALLRALRPEGRVLVVDYTRESPQGPPPAHRLPPEQVIEELVAGGFDASQLDESLPLQYVVVAERPAAAR